MKGQKHLGVYGIVIENNKILLVKKAKGPYTGKLDLPGGTMQFGEKPEQTLKREMLEETGIKINKFELYDANSGLVDDAFSEELTRVHHVGIFYKIFSYSNKIRSDIAIDGQNDDSLGAQFYEVNTLTKKDLSMIAILELEKLGYVLND